MDEEKKKAVKGVAWTSIEKIGKQGIQFVLGIIIARLLTPGDYGIIGMLGIFMALSGVILDSGIGMALTQKFNNSEDDYTTTFIINVTMGLFLYLSLFLAAPFIASFYKTPVLKSVTRIYTLTVIIDSLSIVNRTRLNIKMDFKTQALVALVSILVAGCAGVFFAFYGFGVWALVFYTLIESVIRFLLYTFICRWIPRGRFSKESFKIIFSFGTKTLASNVISTIYNNMYALVIGRKFASTEVGLYNRGKNFAEVFPTLYSQILMKVAFPLFSMIKDDREKFNSTYVQILRIELYFLSPVLTGLFVLSRPLVLLLLKEKWISAVEITQILSLGALWIPLQELNYNFFYSSGRPDIPMKFDLVQKPLAILLLILTIPFGLKWMCIFKAAFACLSFFVSATIAVRFSSLRLSVMLKSIFPSLVASGIMGFCVWGAALLVQSNFLKLIFGFAAGVLVYLLLGLLFKAPPLFEVIKICKSRLGKK